MASLATKPVKMKYYLDELLPIKSHDPMIPWTNKIT